MSGARHVVMFSSGAGSWAAARRVADEHGTDGLFLVFSDVSMEDEDNYRFLREAATDIGGELVWLRDGRDIWQVFKDDAFLGNTRLANCSKFLKQRPARAWLDEHCDPATTVVYVGIDWSEGHRLGGVRMAYAHGLEGCYKGRCRSLWGPTGERHEGPGCHRLLDHDKQWYVEAPLCAPPLTDKAEILADLRRRGIEPPRLYAMGFAHANCGGGCVRAGGGQFAHLLKVMPERYLWWEQNEQDLRDHLDKDVAILRDRRGGKTVPLTLRTFRERHEARPEQTDLLDIGGCGCFVDEGVA
jgi:hypothetical protein